MEVDLKSQIKSLNNSYSGKDNLSKRLIRELGLIIKKEQC